jgi:hypothetical protein
VFDSCAARSSQLAAARLAVLSGSLAAAVFASSAMADPPYRIVDLGPLGFTADPDGIGTFDINDHNQVAYGTVNSGGNTIPAVWLPESAYGFPVPLEGRTIDLFDAFSIAPTQWSTGIAFDINDDGIVVGQVGGVGRNVAGSRAAWWNLNTMTWGTIDPPSPSGPVQPWQDWSRAIAVSEGASPQILVETWDETACRSDCGFQGVAMVGVVGTATVPLGTTVVGSVLRPNAADCFTAALGRDLRVSGGGTEAVGSNGLVTIRDTCTNPTGDPCEALTIGYRWLSGSETELVDLDAVGSERGSQARGLAADGAFVGWGFDVQSGASPCFRRPLYWSSATASPVVLETPGPSISLQFRAEGMTGAMAGGRIAVGWNTSARFPVRWQDDSTADWAYLDLGPFGAATDFSTCSGSGGVDALQYAFDVSEHDWIIAAGTSDTVGSPWHAYLLVPMGATGCVQDVDGDGDVGLSDLLVVLSSFTTCACSLCPGDLDGDGVAGFSDILAVLGAWGPCSGGAGSIPQTVEDCFEKFGSDPVALEACLQAIGGES